MTTALCLHLSNLDMEAEEQADVQLIADYAEPWLANRPRNQLIGLDEATLHAEIGHDWLSQALDPGAPSTTIAHQRRAIRRGMFEVADSRGEPWPLRDSCFLRSGTSLALPLSDPSLSSPDLLLGWGGAWWKAMN